MLSPFPGMDPFLEAPHGWRGFHSRFINSMSDYLAERVSPAYYVQIEENVYLLAPDDEQRGDTIVPDVFVTRGTSTVPTSASSETITAARIVEPQYEQEIREPYLEIHDARTRVVVTTIEVLSPWNKAAGSQGQKDFMRKRNKGMASKAHWLEIDLLRGGERVGDVPAEGDYYALLKRSEPFAPYEIWYFTVRDTMPTIAVPLRPPVPDVPLNLQTVFSTVYQRAHYGESLDYMTRVPPPRLRAPDQAWLEERLKAWAGQVTSDQ